MIKVFFLLMRFAAISEKLIIPTRQVKANRQKQNVMIKATKGCSPLAGVKEAAEVKNLGRRSISIHAPASLPVHKCAITTTNPVNVQMTIVSKNTPIDCTKPCSQGCSVLAAAAAIVMVP